MAERSWDELVAEGRELVQQEGSLQWRWGDLALEVEPMGSARGGRGQHGTGDRLQKWAGEVGFTQTGRALETLLKYREIASAWPTQHRRGDVSHSVHVAFANMPDRFEIITERSRWTLTEALERAGRSVGRRLEPLVRGDAPRPYDVGLLSDREQVEQAREILARPEIAREVLADAQVRHLVDESRPAEDRAEQARRLVRDPAVARHVVQDNRARSAMASAAKEMEVEASDRQRQRAPGLVNLSDFYQATGELSRARQALTKALDAMRRVDLSEDERESLKDDAGRARLVLEWIGSYLESGDHSFDQELDALLREET